MAEKSKGGAPTLYDPSYPKQAEKLCALGATDAEIADFFGVGVRTLNDWKLRHPDLADAMKIGKAVPDDRVERSLYQTAVGYSYVEQQAIKVKKGPNEERVEVVDVERHMPADKVSCIFWLKNRRRDDWKDRHDVVVEDIDAMTPEQVAAAILELETKAAGNAPPAGTTLQ
jgi:hypothetical protein